MTDKLIRRDIMTELEYDPSIDAANIGVAVEDGIVTLTGHLPTYAQKATVVTAVRRVKGVRAIAEKIEIRLANDKKTADDQIAERVAQILEWDAEVPHNRIRITVRDGWVSLAGDVEWHYQRKAAEDAVRKLSGVKAIVNNISIKSGVRVPDLKKRIEEALHRRAEIDAKAIFITVESGTVTLCGHVADWDEHDAVENAVWAAPGVNSVVDRLAVG